MPSFLKRHYLRLLALACFLIAAMFCGTFTNEASATGVRGGGGVVFDIRAPQAVAFDAYGRPLQLNQGRPFRRAPVAAFVDPGCPQPVFVPRQRFFVPRRAVLGLRRY